MTSTAILESEPLLRLAAFGGVFAAVAWWEFISPRRRQAFGLARWPHNLGLLLVDIAVVRLLAPGAVIAVAIAGEARGWGLRNALALPLWVAVPAGIVLLDLAIYFQHVMFHAVPALWRLHRVHHADLDFDVTTGTRFHPLELLLYATAMFNHANASVAPGVERWLRWLLVTPDMHRVHHSVRYEESSSNFGFNLPLWDRIFGTYRAQPRAGHAAMTIGVDAFRSPEEMRLDRLLLQPFRDTPGQYPITRRQAAS